MHWRYIAGAVALAFLAHFWPLVALVLAALWFSLEFFGPDDMTPA